MKISQHVSEKLNWLLASAYFLKKHFIVITGLGLVAASGRVIQLEGFGEIPSWLNIVLEIIVEAVRLLIFLYVLGLASIKNGALRIRRFFSQKNDRKKTLKTALQTIKKQWPVVVLNITGFLVIAAVINFLIEQVAYETCLYITLQKDGILAEAASEWTILLFFKNLSIIPFTLIFDAMFLLWITNKFHKQTYAGS